MASSSDLPSRLRAGEPVFGAFLNLGSPIAAEIVGRAGFDWLLLDLEHGMGDEGGLLHVLHAVASTPASAIVRVEELSRLRIARVLDLGAPGVMVPRLESAEQAREAVSYVRYPPEGIRGAALLTRGARYGTVAHADLRRINDEILLTVQIESTTAVGAAPAMAAVDGVDVLFVGPTDLTHSMGIPGEFSNSDYLDALAAVVHAARGSGKQSGILLQRIEDLPRHLEMGFTVVGLSSDGAFLAAGARAASSGLRPG